MKKLSLPNILICLIFIGAAVSSAFGQTTEFTYQGRLADSGAASTTYDFEFRLCASETDCPTPLATQQRSGVPISGGVFSVKLDFGAANLSADRWLEIAVKRPAQTAYTTLLPRQKITSAPFAVKALESLNAGQLGGVAAASFLQADGDGSNLANVAKLNADNIFAGRGNSFPQITLTSNGEIIAPRLENSATEPAPASAANTGQVYFNTASKSIKVSNGTNWIDLSPAARQIQSFSAQTTEFTLRCDQANVLRSISFTKASAATRLRITYRDKAKTAGSSNFFSANINVKIDGVNATLLTTIFDAENSPFAGSTTAFFSVDTPFTTVGYISGIAAGTHTLSSDYTRTGSNAPVVCYVTNNPYFIEIEELP